MMLQFGFIMALLNFPDALSAVRSRFSDQIEPSNSMERQRQRCEVWPYCLKPQQVQVVNI